MRKTILLSLMVSATMLLTNCSDSKNRGSQGLWTDTDIENAQKNAEFGAKSDPDYKTDAQRKKFCDCWVNKVIELSPDPTKQADIPMDKTIQLNQDCKQEALK